MQNPNKTIMSTMLIKRSSKRLAQAMLGLLAMVWVGNAIADTVKINFRDADVRSVIESVAEITGKSFVLDPRVKGKITIVSPQAIDSELLYEAMLSALQVQGFQAVDDGAIIRVVPFSQSFQIAEGLVGGELQTKVLRIDHVRATELLPVLKPMLSKGSLLQAYDAGNTLVVTDTRSQVIKLETVLAEIDVPEQSAVDVIPLKYISAGEALHIATQMRNFQQQNLSIVEDSFNNRVIVGGPRTARAGFRQLLYSLDVPTDGGQGGVEVIYLNYSSAEDIKPILDGMLESETFLRTAGEAVAVDGNTQTSFRIEVDSDNNALVIAASSSVINQIKSVLRKLDRPRAQVLIEAIIAEVSEDQANTLTVQLAAFGSGAGAYITQFNALLPAVLGTGLDVIQADDDEDVDLTPVTGALSNGSTAAFGGATDGEGIGALVQALKTDTRTTILSSPSVVTLDNEEALLSVGQEVPFITGSFTTTTDTATNPFQTIERQQVGITLRVIPQVNEGNAVRLEIEQESSSLLSATTDLGTADVVTSNQTLNTNVVVGDGQILILGGLADDNIDNSEAKVPILGDIPGIKRLFSSTSRSKDRSVLMMFIRPTILRNTNQTDAVSREKFDYLRSYKTRDGRTLGEIEDTVLDLFEEEKKTDEEAIDPEALLP